jgi:hypothetical protein
MEVLSSRMTFFYKRVFPAIWCGFIVLFTATAFAAGAWRTEPVVLAAPAVMLVFGFFLFRSLLWNLADEVRDGGNVLVVRKGGVEERVRLADILNVDMNRFTNPRRLSLRLRTPGKFGDEIAFIPAWSSRQFNPLARNPIAESLVRRVDAARQEAAR